MDHKGASNSDKEEAQMRVTATVDYFGHTNRTCPTLLEDCERLYCDRHRLLFRNCETSVMGDRGLIELTDECPKCQKVSEAKEWELRMQRSVP